MLDTNSLEAITASQMNKEMFKLIPEEFKDLLSWEMEVDDFGFDEKIYLVLKDTEGNSIYSVDEYDRNRANGLLRILRDFMNRDLEDMVPYASNEYELFLGPLARARLKKGL
jgi:hypothetical protein